MDSMSEQDMQAVAMVLRECSTCIPIELDRDVVILDLSTVDFDALGRGLSNACKPRLLRAYRPDFKAVEWWLKGNQTQRKLKCKTTPRVSAFNKQLDVFSVNDKVYKLTSKGRADRRYLGFGTRVFGQTHTNYIHNLIGAETMARVHPSEWANWACNAWDADYMTFTGFTMHHILNQTATLAGNTPLNLILLDDWTHNTTKVQYNSLKNRILDGDIDMMSKNCILLPKKGAMQAIQNIPLIG